MEGDTRFLAAGLIETKNTNEFYKAWDKFIKDRPTSDFSKWLSTCNLYLRKYKTIASQKLAECNRDE